MNCCRTERPPKTAWKASSSAVLPLRKKFVEEDELDTGVRQLLNFGHTIGHAIEKATDFAVSHGRAVAKGMAMMSDLSAEQGWCSRETAEQITSLLRMYDFDLTVAQPGKILYDICMADKKRKGNYIDIVVPEGIGKCRLQRLTTEEAGRTVMRKIDIIPSKSDAHRALICAALSTKPCQVICQAESSDIAATRKMP